MFGPTMPEDEIKKAVILADAIKKSTPELAKIVSPNPSMLLILNTIALALTRTLGGFERDPNINHQDRRQFAIELGEFIAGRFGTEGE